MLSRRLLVVCLAMCVFVLAGGPAAAGVDAGGEESMQACTNQLQVIHKAIAAYEAEHGKPPDHLSDLHPKYLPDKAALHCAADPTAGDPGRRFVKKDPKLPVSYAYEFSGHESRGLPQPLGKFPKPDVGDSWGTERHVATHQMYFFGEQVPVVRCFHHKAESSDEEKVLNLTRSGRVYRAHGIWEDHPESVAAVLERAGRDLAAGTEVFRERWRLGPVAMLVNDKIQHDHEGRGKYAALLPRAKSFAGQLLEAAPQFPNEERRFVYRAAADLYNSAGEPEKALAAVRQAIAAGAAVGDYAPGKLTERWSQSDQDMVALARIYRQLKRHPDELAVWLLMHARKPDNNYYVSRIADALEAMSQPQAAVAWRDKAEPGRLLVGKAAPDFSLPLVSGQTVSLKDASKGKKAVLVNFWFVGCGPCHAEAPHLQALYAALKDKGLEVVSIDLGDGKEAVEGFVRKHGLTFPVALGGNADRGKDTVFSRYGVDAYPSNYLVDAASGNVVWRRAGYSEDQIAALRGELAKLGVK